MMSALTKYERWWVGRKCRVSAAEPFRRVASINMANPEVGPVHLVFDDGSTAQIGVTGKHVLPVKRNVEVEAKNINALDWAVVVAKSISIFLEFVARGVVPTLRTIYYALVSKEIIPNTKNAYKGLSSAFVDARKEGKIKWSWIADETRHAELGERTNYWDKDDYTQAVINQTAENLKESLEGSTNYSIPKWHNQPYYVEVWIEKAALQATFKKYLEKWKVTLVPSRGYTSWTFLKDAADRIREKGEGKTPVIVYFGDFDPSGVDIERHIRESLNHFSGVNVEVKRICVTEDQIREYDLPAIPEDAEEIEKLQRDSRYNNWGHGLFRVELDALLAIVPDEFERLVNEAVQEYFDEEIGEENENEAADSQEHIMERLKKELPKRIRRLLREMGLEGDDEDTGDDANDDNVDHGEDAEKKE